VNTKNHSISVRIRYSETDQMGVVYHGNYPQYLEMARVEWLRHLGVSYKEMEQAGIMLPVTELSIKYKSPAYYDDRLSVKVNLSKMPLVRIEFDYEITNENNKLICTANTVLAFINMKSKKPMKCPEYIIEKLGDIKF
jgi:acyl-CoA thioester hydrolase